MDPQIEIKRETEFYQGFIRLKMSVSNKTSFVITDVTLDFIFEDSLLHIDHYEPKTYKVKNNKVLMGNINGDMDKSISVYFDPLTCTGRAKINCQVNYMDAQGELCSDIMQPKTISVLCPIFKTEFDINVGRLKELVEALPSRDSKIYEIHDGFDIDKMVSIARGVIEKHDVRHVRTLKTKEGGECEIWYYGRTKIEKFNIVIKISISPEEHLIELFAATESIEALTGLLAELGRDLKDNIETMGLGKNNNVNITVRRSMLQRSKLLDLCDSNGNCPVNILVEDSMVLHTDVMSRIDINRKEKKTRKEEFKQKNTEEQKILEEQERKQIETAREVQGTKQPVSTPPVFDVKSLDIEKLLKAPKDYVEQERKQIETAREVQGTKQPVSTPLEKKVYPEIPVNSSSKKNRAFMGIVVILGILLIFTLASYIDSDSSNANSSQLSDVNRSYFPQVKYNSSAWENQKYSCIRVRDKCYVPLKLDSNKTAELVVDSGDKYTIKKGEKFDFGKGYTLEAKQIEVDGEKVWFEFDKDGKYIDDKIFSPESGDGTWTCIVNNLQGENNVPVLKVHVNQVFQGAVDGIAQIDGIWLIDFTNVSSVTPSNELNEYKNSEDLEAIFTFSNLVIDPIEVRAGKEAKISIDAENTGNAAGEYDVELIVNDISVDSQKIFLGVGESKTVVFEHSEEVPDSYNVKVGDQETTYTVKEKSSILLYSLIGIILLVAGGIAYRFTKGGWTVATLQAKVDELVESANLKK